MEERTPILTVLFADVSGSTRYFKEFGDSGGRRIVTACLECVAATIAQYGGEVIDRIGDELMCILPDASRSLQAAAAIQQSISAASGQGDLPTGIKLRVGLHYGPITRTKTAIFGDTVHTAKRIVDLAKGDQVLTTDQTLAAAGKQHWLSSRFVDRTRIKGHSDPIEVHELVWNRADVTILVAGPAATTDCYSECRVIYGQQEFLINEGRPSLSIGRASECDVVVNQDCVSRQHGQIELLKGRLIYIDRSTNGTYVLEDSSEEGVLIRREEGWLRNSGRIFIGQTTDEDGCLTLKYTCR